MLATTIFAVGCGNNTATNTKAASEDDVIKLRSQVAELQLRLEHLEKNNKSGGVSKAEFDRLAAEFRNELNKLTAKFNDELDALGVRVAGIEKKNK